MEFLEGGTLDDAVGEDYEFQEKHIAFVCKEVQLNCVLPPPPPPLRLL